MKKNAKDSKEKDPLEERVQIRLGSRTKERVTKFQAKFKEKTRAAIGLGEAIRILVDDALDRQGIR